MKSWVERILATVSVVLLASSVAACSGGGVDPTAKPYVSPSPSSPANPSNPKATLTVYASPTCGCCHLYIPYLRENGYAVNEVSVQDINAPKEKYGVPEEAWSCHTATVDGYFIEGHVPVEAIDKLLTEKPAIDGIALPGMPPGSPGMNGEKTARFEIVAIKDGKIQPFMTI
jgi:hypothetical protein